MRTINDMTVKELNEIKKMIEEFNNYILKLRSEKKDEYANYLEKNKEEIINLSINSNYEEIFYKYDRDMYLMFTPDDYKKQEIENLLKNNNNETLRRKYNEKIDNIKVKKFDNMDKIKKAKLDKTKLPKKIIATGLAAITLISSGVGLNRYLQNNRAVKSANETVSTSNYINNENSTTTTPIETEATTITETTTTPTLTETTTTPTLTETTTPTLAETTTTPTLTETTTPTLAETKTETETTPIETEIVEEIDNPQINYNLDVLNEYELKNFNLFVETKDYLDNNSKDSIKNILDLNDNSIKYSDKCAFYNIPFLAGISLYNSNVTKNNIILYNEELDEYNNSIEEYAKEINSLNLTDAQIIAKVMDDMWKSTEEGYGEGKLDVYGLFRLDINRDDTTALCRNFADDFTAKMNAINPDYEAVNLTVYCDSSCYGYNSSGNIIRSISNEEIEPNYYKYVDMPIYMNKFLKDTSYEVYPISGVDNKQLNNYYIEVKGDKDITEFSGNHTVSMISIKDEETKETKYHLIVDPTNVNISVLKDGKIYVLSNKDYKGLELTATGTVILDPLEDSYKIASAVIDSNVNSDEINLEELKELYGVEALNENLDYVRNNLPKSK